MFSVGGRAAIVVAGVVGSGRGRFGRLLAETAGLDFIDGDSLPGGPTAGIRHNAPPVGDHRSEWLDRISAALSDTDAHPAGAVATCSALRRADRDRLRWRAAITRFVHLEIDPVLHRRLNRFHRLVPSEFTVEQFLSIELPRRDEPDAVVVDAMLAHNRFAAREVVDLDPPIELDAHMVRSHVRI